MKLYAIAVVLYVVVLGVGALLSVGAPRAQVLGLQDLPDDVRATVKKELARKSGSEVSNDDVSTGPEEPGSRRSKSCSISLGATESPGRGRRDMTVVTTRPIVQVCR